LPKGLYHEIDLENFDKIYTFFWFIKSVEHQKI
jgi:hypothetical protein